MYDAIIIGGSYAGLSAALHIARARRNVLVIDAGSPRNRFSAHSHGVFAQDGRSGSALLADARAQVAAYPTATLAAGSVTGALREENRFVVTMENGETATARGIVLATGVTDVLPAISGLAERWGKSVLHCPYCHGYEIGGGSIGVLGAGPHSVHQASLAADWGDVTLFTNNAVPLDEAARALLANRRVRIEPSPITQLEGGGESLEGARLADGRFIPMRALFLGPNFRLTSPIAERLGCAFDETPVGALLRTDMWKATTVPMVYAAGDISHMRHSITGACAEGVFAGVGLHQALIAEDGAAPIAH